MDAFLFIIIDILNIVLLIVAFAVMMFIYRKTHYRAIIFFNIAVIFILLGPAFELLAFYAPSRELAEYYIKISGIGANISVFFLVIFVVYSQKGNIDWVFPSLMAFLEGYLFYDIAVSEVDLTRSGDYWTYTRYFSDIGALLIALITLIFIIVAVRLALSLLSIIGTLKSREAGAIRTYSLSVFVGASLVVLGFALEAFTPGISRIAGPVGVLIFILGITISLVMSPYALTILPTNIYGYMLFRRDGLLILSKFFLDVSIDPNLLSSGLSAIALMLSEATGSPHELSIIRLGPLNCVLAQKENLLFALFLSSVHPELIATISRILDRLIRHKELIEAPIVTDEHESRLMREIDNELEPYLAMPRGSK